MGVLDNLKKTAQKTATSVSQAAMTAQKSVVQTASEVGKVVAQTALGAGKAVADATSVSAGKVSAFSQSAYDSICEFAAQKIKTMLRGMNLQSTIDALNKNQEEKGTDVSALVNFINELKNFSEDGEE